MATRPISISFHLPDMGNQSKTNCQPLLSPYRLVFKSAPVYNHDSFWSVSQEQTQSQLAPVGALVGELGRGAAHGWRARLHPPPRPPQSERPPRDVHHQRAQLPEALGHSRETRGTRRSASCHHATVHTKGGGGGFYSHWRQNLLSFTYTMVSYFLRSV